MISDSPRDWKTSGLTIRQAIVKARAPDADGPIRIRWGDHLVVNGDFLTVPAAGTVRLHFLAGRPNLRQGADLAVRGGIFVAGGMIVPLLRTWFRAELSPVVEYRYSSDDNRLFTCNVYDVSCSEANNDWRWGDYAGMWVETLKPTDRIYHCSHTESSEPDFEDLVYRVSIL